MLRLPLELEFMVSGTCNFNLVIYLYESMEKSIQGDIFGINFYII